MKKIISISAGIVFMFGTFAPSFAEEAFLDNNEFDQRNQELIREKFAEIDVEIEEYLASISSYEGKLVDLVKEIGDRFTRIGDKSEEESFFDRHVDACREAYKEAALEAEVLVLGADTLPLIDCQYSDVIEQKMIAYKRAALIFAMQQMSRLQEASNTQYMEETHDMSHTLFRMMGRFRAKVGEAARNFRFTEHAYDGL